MLGFSKKNFVAFGWGGMRGNESLPVGQFSSRGGHVVLPVRCHFRLRNEIFEREATDVQLLPAGRVSRLKNKIFKPEVTFFYVSTALSIEKCDLNCRFRASFS